MATLLGCASNGSNKPHQNAVGETLYTDFSEYIKDLFTKVRPIVEAHTKTDLSHVSIMVVGDSQIRDLSISNSKQLYSDLYPEPDVLNEVLEKTTPEGLEYLAMYDIENKRILVHETAHINSFSTLSSKESKHAGFRSLLIHELIHAVDDIKLNAFQSRKWSNILSYNAIIEGHAEYETERICRTNACYPEFKQLQKLTFLDTPEAATAEQKLNDAYFHHINKYAYYEGQRFIQNLAFRDPNLIDLAFKHPPLAASEILRPQRFPDTARETKTSHLQAIKQTIQDHLKDAWRVVATQPSLRTDHSSTDLGIMYSENQAITTFLIAKKDDANLPLIDLTLYQMYNAESARAIITNRLKDLSKYLF